MDVKVPELGDSIQEVQIATWMKQVGDWVDRDEEIVELESEKASQNFPTPEAGVITSINVAEGEFAKIGDVLCVCLLYTSPSPRDQRGSRMPSSA